MPALTFPGSGARYYPYESFCPKWTPATNVVEYRDELSSDAGFTPVKNQVMKRTTLGFCRPGLR